MIRLPVSIGEAIDKLTILDIKIEKIQDPTKKAYCQEEYNLLHTELEPYLEKHAFSYARLRDVNLQIWEMQDDIRVRPDPQKCVEILDKNDMRFRIKDVINQTVQSHLREQKGYPARRALVIGHLGVGDHIGLIGAVRYIAMQHDETVVVCKRQNAGSVAAFFADNPTIKLWPVDAPYMVNPSSTNAGEVVPIDPNKFTNVYRSGFYSYPNHGFDDLPKCFYRDMGFDPEIRHTHFYVPTTQEARDLYSLVSNQPYIFVQQRSSTHMTPLVTWDSNEILTIDPNVNVYPEGHRWHSIAQSFVNRNFLDYTLTIQNAKEIHTVDSSFYCIACYLPLKSEVKRCYARETGAFIPTYTFN
jgi:hypothetical protein